MKKLIILIFSINLLFAEVVELVSGIKVSNTLLQGEMKIYKITTEAGQTAKSLLSGLTNDGDLYVKIGSEPTLSSFDCKSLHASTRTESCSVTPVANEDVYIGIYAYRTTEYEIKVTLSSVQHNIFTLTSGQSLNANVLKGEIKQYRLKALKGERVEALLYDLSNDADLYIKVGSKARPSNYDCKSTHAQTIEDRCSVLLSKDSNVFITVLGYQSAHYQINASIKAINSHATLLNSDEVASDSILRDDMKYYKIPVKFADTLSVLLTSLHPDADIYLKIGGKPTKTSYDCKSTMGGTKDDVCSLAILDDTEVYIAVFGFRSTNYTLKATIHKDEVPSTPTLLEDAEDGTLNPNWITIRGDKDSFVCTSEGKNLMANYGNGGGNALHRYRLPLNNSTQKVLSMDIGGGTQCDIGYGSGRMPHYSVGVIVQTKLGRRSMEWNSWYTHQGYEPRKHDNGHNIFLNYPSPVEMVRGFDFAPLDQWEHFEVNLDTELQRIEPENRIYKITEFFVTGGFLDNIMLSSAP